jgi:hypothetical protein
VVPGSSRQSGVMELFSTTQPASEVLGNCELQFAE